MDKWDPCREDFKDQNFNSYVKGPGRNLPTNRGKGTKPEVQLFVTGIPNEITQDGLLNLFSRAGKVISVKKIPSKKEGAGDTYGFVVMGNAIDAEKAIREFNNFKIDRFNLRVKVSMNEQEKRRRNFQHDLMLVNDSAFGEENDSDPDADAAQNMTPNGGDVNGFGPGPGKRTMGRGQVLEELTLALDDAPLASPKVNNKSPGQQSMKLSVTVDKDNQRVLSADGGVGRGITLTPNKEFNTDHIGRGGHKSRGGGRCFTRGGYGRGYQEGYYDNKPRRGRGGGGRGRGYMQPYGRGMPYPPYQQPPMMYGMPMIDPYTYNMMAAAGASNMMAAGASQHLLQPAYPVMPSPMISAAGAAAQYQTKVTEKKTTSTSTETKNESSVTSECSVCNKLGTQRCSRCKEPYCSLECQAKDWPEHKKICKILTSEKELSADFARQFDVSIGDELIPKVKELMEKAVGGSIEISRKPPKAAEPKPGSVSDAGSDHGTKDRDKSGTDRKKKGSGDNRNGGGSKKSPGCLNCGSKEHFRKDCTEPVGVNQQCYNCKKKGHLSRECPGKSENRCYNCNQAGHFSRECPEKAEKKVNKSSVPQAKTNVPNGDTFNSRPPKPEATEATGSKPSQVKAQSKKSGISPPPKKSLAAEVLQMHQEVEVVVTEVLDPSTIYVQNINDEKILLLTQIMAAMAEKFHSSPSDVNNAMVGEIYSCKYSVDQAWYRVQVLKVDGSLVTVQYIDFGNQEVTSMDNLRQLDTSMIKLPAQAVLCSLEGILPVSGSEWKIASGELQRHVTPNMPYKVISRNQLDRPTGKAYEITMKNEKGDNVGQNIVSAGLAKLKTSSGPGGYQSANSTKSPTVSPEVSRPPMVRDLPRVQSTLTVGQEIPVFITDASSPLTFTVQVLTDDNIKAYQTFNAQFQELYRTQDTPYKPTVGELVASRFTGDEDWYRGEITAVSNAKARVVFIDYGNSEEVSNQVIRKALPLCTTVPIQAVYCSLYGVVAPASGDWSEPVLLLLQKLLLQPLMAIVKEVKDGIVGLELYQESGGSVGEQVNNLLMKGAKTSPALASAPAAVEPARSATINIGTASLPLDGTKAEVVVSKIISLSKFYVQLGDAETRQQHGKMWTDLNESYATAVPYEAQIGEFVAAQYTEGEVTLWYRARIAEKLDGGVYQAFFIDYGNTETVKVESVSRLEDRFTRFPCMAVCCKLAGCEAIEEPSALQEFGKHLEVLSLARAVHLKNGVYSVEIYQPDETNINQRIMSLATASSRAAASGNSKLEVTMPVSPPVTNTADVPRSIHIQETSLPLDGSEVLGIVVFIESLSSFCVQIVNEELQERLGTLVTLNQICEQDGGVYEASVGEYVSAMFTVDSSWYRAKVIGKTEAGVEVFFVDFGNTDVVPEVGIRKHCNALDTIPSLAVKCTLAGSGSANDAEKLEEFNSVLNQAVKVKAVEKMGDRFVVEMFLMNDEATSVNLVLNLDTANVATSEGATGSNQKQTAKSTKPSEAESSLPKIEIEQLPLGKPLSAAPMLINSVNEFYVQSADEKKQEHLVEILLKLREIYQDSATPYTPVIGEYVAVLFNDGIDELWYRALVREKIADDQFQLCLVDYGNLITAKTDLIGKLDDKFFSYPWLAFKCRLAGFDIDTEDTRKEFSSRALNMEMTMTAKAFENGTYQVELVQQDGKNVAEHLLSVTGTASACTDIVDHLPKCETPEKEPLPRKSASPSSGERKVVFAQTLAHSRPEADNITVVITSVVRPNQFHCQIFQEEQTHLQELKLLSDTMKLDCEHSLCVEDPKFEVGELCCAKFPEDGEWYRARVLEVFPDKTAKVFYVDFGNQCEVAITNLRPVRLEYTVLPLLAFKCTLHGVSPVGASWSQDASSKLKEFENRPLRARVMEVKADVYDLDLEDMNGENIGKQLIKAGMATPTKPAEENKEAEMELLQRQNQILQQKVSDMQAMMAKMLKK